MHLINGEQILILIADYPDMLKFTTTVKISWFHGGDIKKRAIEPFFDVSIETIAS